MKFHLLILSMLSMVLTTSINAQSTNGLVAHWDLNGNTNDRTGNGHNGTAQGISYTQGRNGINTTAAKFSNGAYISVPNHSDFNFTKYSICVQLLIDSFNTYYCQNSTIIRKGQEHTAGAWGLQMFDNPYDSSCTITGDTTGFVFGNDAGVNNTSVYHANWRYSPTTRTKRWYCIVATFDSTEYKVYVDGVLKTTVRPSAAIQPIGSNTQVISIGRNLWGNQSQYPYFLYGVIDDIKIYNRALSQAEVSQLCNPIPTISFDGTFTDTVLCLGSTFNVTFNTSDTFQSGNIYTVQLSDANGSFASPTTIGTLTSQTSGTIACTIPLSTPVGNKYRVRVVSSNPYTESPDNGVNINIVSTIGSAVSITATPSANVGPLTPITFTAMPVNGGASPTYMWLKNSAAIPGATGSTYVGVTNVDFVSGDQISLRMISGLSCAEPSDVVSNVITVNVDLSVNGLTLLNNAAIYPNPNNGTFTIKGQVSNNKEVRINVIDAIGRTVYKGAVTPNGYELNETINVGRELPTGTYMLQLQSDDAVSTLRFTVHH